MRFGSIFSNKIPIHTFAHMPAFRPHLQRWPPCEFRERTKVSNWFEAIGHHHPRRGHVRHGIPDIGGGVDPLWIPHSFRGMTNLGNGEFFQRKIWRKRTVGGTFSYNCAIHLAKAQRGKSQVRKVIYHFKAQNFL